MCKVIKIDFFVSTNPKAMLLERFYLLLLTSRWVHSKTTNLFDVTTGHKLIDIKYLFVAGKTGLVECAYVASNITDASYFASPILLGQNGVERNLGVGQLSDFEADKLANEVLPELKTNIAKGEEFVANYGKAE